MMKQRIGRLLEQNEQESWFQLLRDCISPLRFAHAMPQLIACLRAAGVGARYPHVTLKPTTSTTHVGRFT
jgi:hypothetical protein